MIPLKNIEKYANLKKEHHDWIKKELGTQATMFTKQTDYYLEEEKEDLPVVYYNGKNLKQAKVAL